jgi:uncharacterized protein
MISTLSPAEIKAFLTRYDYGHIGCTDGDKVYIVPVSYKYLGNYFLVHSREGSKVEIMRKHPFVCFQVDHVTDYTHWHCVIAWGNYEEIKNNVELKEVQGMFDDPTLDVKASLPSPVVQDNTVKDLIFYKINVTEIFGRYEYGDLANYYTA